MAVTGNGPAMSQALQAALARASQPALRRDLVRVMGEAVLSKTTERFALQRDPYDRPWPQSIRAKLEGGQTLSNTGALRRSFNFRVVSTDRGAVSSPLKYAATHQHGAVIEPKSRKVLRFRLGNRVVFAQSVTIPQRMMLPEASKGWPPEYLTEIEASLTAALKAALTP